MAQKKTVVIGFLGTKLDVGGRQKRWERWRPSISLCQHDDLLVDRFELLTDNRHARQAKQVSADINQVSPETQVRMNVVSITDPWDFEEMYGMLHDFASGYKFRPDHEDYLIHITTGTHVAQICMFLLTEAHYFPARLLQTSPGKSKADIVGTWTAINLDLSKYDKLASRFVAEKQEDTAFLKSGIDTKNPAFNMMIDEIEQVAIRSRAPVLLLGPTGAGKSLLASRVYALKKNRHQIDGPFIEVNCATLRGDSAMSALFGHKKGSFTGAAGDRAGLLKAADGGVLFLDEIGELGADEQAMTLRALEEGRFLPVGADREVSSSFQLIAGTNTDLGQAVQAGKFREDLYARLNLWTFHLPGLVDRREDIEPNLDYELARFSRDNGSRVIFNTEARNAYMKFALSGQARWSANFRDLSASITRMATFAVGGRIGMTHVSKEIARLQHVWGNQKTDRDDILELEKILGDRLQQVDLFDQSQLAAVIAVCRQSRNMAEAGRLLFAQSRKAKANPNDSDRLRKYLAKFDLEWAMVAAQY